ncbi:MAG: tetratricopeptide repeat protein [Kofleriaceae bacterium]
MIVPRLVLAFCILAVTARVASADDPALRAAKHHFERGEKLYALTRFSEALDEYQLAFDAKPLPDFLFNIGQCYRNLADYDSAIFSYKKYLRLAPAAPNREKVEQLITELEAQRDHSDTRRLGLERKRTPATGPPPSDPRPIYKTWWFWTGVGVVAAAGGGFAAYELTRTSGPPDTSLGNIVFGK